MLNKIFGLSIACIVISFSGCGGSGSDDGLDLDAQVTYKTSGTYDLRNYIIPTENSLSVYDQLNYTNTDGKTTFKDDPERSTYTEKYDVNTTQVIVKDGNDQIDHMYDIQADRILELDPTGNVQYTFARFADMDDYVLSSSSNNAINNIPTVTKNVCQVKKHYDTKEIDQKEYTDVLEISCQSKTEGESVSDQLSLSYQSEATHTSYFAKDIGLVYSEVVNCEELKTTLSGQSTTQATCRKEIDNLISHNRL